LGVSEGTGVIGVVGGELIGFVLSEASVTQIPISIFSGEPEISVREEELVIIHDEEHRGTPMILGVLRGISRLEPYLRRRVKVGIEEYPEAIDRIEKLAYTNVSVVPLAEIIVGENNVVGINRNVTYVPFPGSKVYRVGDGSIITRLLRETIEHAKEPIVVGTHKYSLDIQIPLDPSYIQYHIGVFGATGMGKSRLVKVLADEIVKNTEYAVIIFDHTGMDYAPFYPESTISSLEIQLGPLGIADFFLKRLRLSEHYTTYLELFGMEVSRSLEELRERLENTTDYDTELREIHREITGRLQRVSKSIGARDDTVRSLGMRMQYFVEPEVLGEMILKRRYSPEQILEKAREYKRKGLPLVIDLSFEETIEMRRTIIGDIIEACWEWIFRKNFLEQQEGKRRYVPINLVVVIDEAQNYAWGSGYCKEQIERVAREGRKWKFGLIVVSQRLARSIDTDIRANINTIFFSRLSQTTDLGEIQKFADITGIDVANLFQLMPREFYVAGLMNPLRKPIAIRVREVKDVI